MKIQTSHTVFDWIVAAAVCLALAACSAAAPANPQPSATRVASQMPTFTPAPPTATPEPPTPTALPDTPTPQPTLPPTTTLTPTLGLLPGAEGFTAWCLPPTAQTGAGQTDQPWVKPPEAKPLEIVADEPQLTYPALRCVFSYAFNQPAPPGLKLEFYDAKYNQPIPWLAVDLTAAESDHLVFAVITHSYVIDPPLWRVDYRLVVRAADGSELWSSVVHFVRSWQMGRCWNGTFPNPITLECPKITWGDVHPTDWGYGLPTHTPDAPPAE